MSEPIFVRILLWCYIGLMKTFLSNFFQDFKVLHWTNEYMSEPFLCKDFKVLHWTHEYMSEPFLCKDFKVLHWTHEYMSEPFLCKDFKVLHWTHEYMSEPFLCKDLFQEISDCRMVMIPCK